MRLIQFIQLSQLHLLFRTKCRFLSRMKRCLQPSHRRIQLELSLSAASFHEALKIASLNEQHDSDVHSLNKHSLISERNGSHSREETFQALKINHAVFLALSHSTPKQPRPTMRQRACTHVQAERQRGLVKNRLCLWSDFSTPIFLIHLEQDIRSLEQNASIMPSQCYLSLKAV